MNLCNGKYQVVQDTRAKWLEKKLMHGAIEKNIKNGN